MNEDIKLKSISELLGESFYIPSYQRGYRWAEQQVVELLEDLASFSKEKKEGEFYCLQPIVVNEDNGKYRVIDGQQRLTTIYLILKYFNEVEFKRPKSLFNIFFETRASNEDFFKELNSDFLEKDKICKTDIDKFYMSSAYLEIDKWFTDKISKNQSFIQDFYPVLLDSVKVIWYEINDKNEIDVFTRLNIGKIPLTNAELIKALFLINIGKNNESEKILLASQWDEIEYKLQDKEFFAFINGKEFNKPTKIEYIFDVMAKSEKHKQITIKNLAKGDDKRSFYIFNSLIKDEKSSKQLWDEVKKYFRIFNELHTDNKYYHLVGYLVNNGKNIGNISQNFLTLSKVDFLAYLQAEIASLFKFKKDKNDKNDKTLENIKYDEDYNLITKILFLFNVISTMNSGYSRYPFNLHKQEDWSLEHIHAQQSEDITKDEDRRQLLNSQLNYIDEELKGQIEQIIKDKKIDNEKFGEIQEKIFKMYSDVSNVHAIDNLALLGKDDNSSLNNSIFPAKRDGIKELDRNGSFIPIGTKNVFLKYYSDNVTEGLMWNKEDREAYLKAIKNTLVKYIGEKNDK
jgi:uncharacterized protein with ParB-like and HNH nuclease domain